MFESLKLRVFVARVQAELIAQHKDQDFVNTVCQLNKTLDGLNEIRKHAYYKKDKIAPFMAACYVLGEALEYESLPRSTKDICAELLFQRLCKAQSNQGFHMKHFQVFGDLEKKLTTWRANENA